MKLMHVLAASCLAWSASSWALESGQMAPDIAFSAPSVSKLSDLKGKVVYLDFWASWCGPCKESFPWMNAMHQKFAAQGLQVVAVNLDAKRADADRFLGEVPAQFMVGFDATGQSAKQVGVKGMPTSVLIGADGKVLAVHQGFKAADRAELETKMAQALKPVAAVKP
jgi:cytochrome c biogenesis protein CcmG, thiol:disulfide interchange protein DsbE